MKCQSARLQPSDIATSGVSHNLSVGRKRRQARIPRGAPPHQRRHFSDTMSPTRLASCIVTPRRLAGIFDWKKNVGSVLALDIRDDKIGVSVVKHPSTSSRIHMLHPIPYSWKRRIKRSRPSAPSQVQQEVIHAATRRQEECKERVAIALQDIIERHKVCGFVVCWLLQPDGRPGGAAGKVLHLLDYLAAQPSPMLANGRPFALWDTRDVLPNDATEEKHIGTIQSERLNWESSTTAPPTPSQVADINDSELSLLVLQRFLDSHWDPADEEKALHY